MATAHEREGQRELAGERLALAVEVSGRGVAEIDPLRPLPERGHHSARPRG